MEKQTVLLLSHEGYLLSLEILTGRIYPPLLKLSPSLSFYS